jgi:thymidylate synthase
MTAHHYAHVNDALSDLLDEIVNVGARSAPRGKPIMELLGHSATFDMRYPLVTLKARELGYRFAPAEAAWILGGENRVARITRYSKFIWSFSDDGFFYQGAYGPQVIRQLSYICDSLADDHDTRQAVMTIWQENPRISRDIPCTLSFQFLIRNSRLHVVQCMRSSDAWLGYSYDAFNATMLAGYVMLLLRDRKERGIKNLEGLGTHTMMIGSSHVYDVNADKAKAVVENGETLFEADPFDPFEFKEPDALIDHLWALARGDFDACPGTYLVEQLKNLPTK